MIILSIIRIDPHLDQCKRFKKSGTSHSGPKTSVQEFNPITFPERDELTLAGYRSKRSYPRRKMARSLDDHALCTALNAFGAL